MEKVDNIIIMSFKSIKALNDRHEEIWKKIETDNSLTEEEKKYYKQLAKSISDATTEELKEFRKKMEENLLECIKESNPSVLDKYPEDYDPRDQCDFPKIIEFANLKKRIFDYFFNKI